MSVPAYVRSFGQLLHDQKPPKPLVVLGELALAARHVARAPLQYNKRPFELLKGAHDYIVEIGGTAVELSAQLYLNTREHYRLFAYSRAASATGMLFSLNLTTSKEVDGAVGLSQRIRFSEGRTEVRAAGSSVRDAKTRLFADILTRSQITVTDNFEIQLGTYSTSAHAFLDTTPAKFVSQFLSIALLKGHFQGNKGYQFACLPRFDDSFAWKWDSSDAVRAQLAPNTKGTNGVRSIPLGLRYRVLERDASTCTACGATPADGATLHIDHIKPFSLGGLSILSNLQTLCSDCNLGKGNRSSTDHRSPRVRAGPS